jgi:hypothetical protein
MLTGKLLARACRRNGRPPFELADSQRQIAQLLRSNGIPQRTIAANIGCDVGTLRKHFRVELADCFEQVVAAVGAALVRAALAGNVLAAKYWLSTRCGPEWRITNDGRLSGTVDLQRMSPEDLECELATLRAKQAAANEEQEKPPARSTGENQYVHESCTDFDKKPEIH